MNREIKFRGIEIGTKGQFVYGGYFNSSEEEGLLHYIFCNVIGAVNIYDHTVAQFTGVYDKNGKEIYEGDILDFGNKNYVPVVFDNGCFNVFDEPLGWDFNSEEIPVKTNFNYCEIVGNIYENPELLIGGEK